MLSQKRKLKVLDFDLENRPLSYIGGDFTSSEITAIASCWADNFGTMQVKLLGRDDPEDMLNSFRERYEEADIVVGHYIRKHDLPKINGALMEFGLPTLSPKMSHDTYFDLKKRNGISSSQESLAEMFGIAAPKIHMSQGKWRDGNRLTITGILATENRARGDVIQNILLREYMVKNRLLKAPKIWRP